MRPLRAAGAALAFVIAAEGCSSDLFHATEWSSRCERDPAWRGCPTGAATTSATVGGGGEGGGGGAGGAAGAGGSAAATTAAVTSGAGGGGGCVTCNDLLLANEPLTPNPGAFCTAAGSAAHAALRACACDGAACMTECAVTCGGGDADMACASCAALACEGQIGACQGS